MTESDFRAGPSSDDPAAQLLAVHKALAAVQDEVKALLQRPDDRKRLGQAAARAYADTGQGTQAGCQAAVADIAGADALIGKYTALHKFPNARTVALALEAAGPRLARIVWTKPPLATVSVSVPPGDVQASATAPTTIRATLHRTGDTSLAAACTVAWTGLAPDPIVDTCTFRPGEADAVVAVTIPAQPGMSSWVGFQLALRAPLVGLTLGTPATGAGRLLPPAVDPPPPLPTLTLTGPGDITPATDLMVDAAATVALSAPTDHDVTADYTIAGARPGDLLSPAAASVTVRAGSGIEGIPIILAPLTLAADRPLSLALGNIVGAAPPFPPALTFSLLRNTVAPPADGPSPIDLARRVKVGAAPATLLAILNHASPGQAVLLPPGSYPKFNVNVPDLVVYAERYGTVTVGGDVDLHAAGATLLSLDVRGHIRCTDAADGARASNCRSLGSRSVDGAFNALGKGQVFDRCEADGFLGIGGGAEATTRGVWWYQCHWHGQDPATVAPTKSMCMMGKSHVMSAVPINARFTRCLLVRNPRLAVHDGIEFKSANGLVEGCTLDDVDAMVRHGTPAARFLSVFTIGRGGSSDGGGYIRLTDDGPQAVRCKTTGTGLLAVEAGTVSGDQLRAGQAGYAYAQRALVAHHDGKVVIGWARSGWSKPPLGTRIAGVDPAQVHRLAGDVATVDYTDPLPPEPVQLTPADVGPLAS